MTMTPKLRNIWIGMRSMDEEIELRLDWSNDYHHAVTIKRPHGPEEVADALRDAAMFVYRDSQEWAKAGRKE